MSDWQPIDTAPPNEPVLVWVVGELRLARWKYGSGWNSWLTIPGQYQLPVQPTHWRPVPDPPTEAR